MSSRSSRHTTFGWDANFKEDQLERMAPGQSATVIADVLPDHVFHGHVISLAPATGAAFSVTPPENATGNFTKIVQRVAVRVKLDARRRRCFARSGRACRQPSAWTRDRVQGARNDRRAFHRELGPKPGALRGHVRGHVHRPARHPDRRFLASGHRRRPVGGAGPDQLGADRLSDRRDHRDPAVGLADARLLDRWLFTPRRPASP